MGFVGERRDEDRDDLVTDELVDDSILVHEHLGRHRVEAIEEVPELGRRHVLGERRRAPDVGKEQ